MFFEQFKATTPLAASWLAADPEMSMCRMAMRHVSMTVTETKNCPWLVSAEAMLGVSARATVKDANMQILKKTLDT
ncbi:MAG: hypothetical protein KGJ08_06215 [Gammaproteobacteria bacterium]|nr:hypothetical protein [Gammaproteobacteria bacterium]